MLSTLTVLNAHSSQSDVIVIVACLFASCWQTIKIIYFIISVNVL